MTKFFNSLFVLVLVLGVSSASASESYPRKDHNGPFNAGTLAYIDKCENGGRKVIKLDNGKLDCVPKTAAKGDAPSRVASAPATASKTDAEVEKLFRDDCADKKGTVYTAAEWNAKRPGANLVGGQLHCNRATTWTADAKK